MTRPAFVAGKALGGLTLLIRTKEFDDMKMRRGQNGLTGWSPLSEIHRLRSEINRLFEAGGWPMGTAGERGWLPPMDIHQDQDKFTVTAELPGFNRENLDVSVRGNSLKVSGERNPEPNPEGEPFQAERFYGRFEREVMLPEEVDAERVSATYKDGVLCIYLPKTAQARRKQIQVQPS